MRLDHTMNVRELSSAPVGGRVGCWTKVEADIRCVSVRVPAAAAAVAAAELTIMDDVPVHARVCGPSEHENVFAEMTKPR